jgi:hypothetical protein
MEAKGIPSGINDAFLRIHQKKKWMIMGMIIDCRLYNALAITGAAEER